MKLRDAVLRWTPNRRPFDDQATAGTILVTTLPLPQHDYGHMKTYGATNLEWRQMSVYDRRQKLQRLFSQIVYDDFIPEQEVRLALSAVDDIAVATLSSTPPSRDQEGA